jgi:hypothetical protein
MRYEIATAGKRSRSTQREHRLLLTLLNSCFWPLQHERNGPIRLEGAVEFAQYVLLNAARIWSESSPEQKQRLQKLIFPSGVLFAEGT